MHKISDVRKEKKRKQMIWEEDINKNKKKPLKRQHVLCMYVCVYVCWIRLPASEHKDVRNQYVMLSLFSSFFT